MHGDSLTQELAGTETGWQLAILNLSSTVFTFKSNLNWHTHVWIFCLTKHCISEIPEIRDIPISLVVIFMRFKTKEGKRYRASQHVDRVLRPFTGWEESVLNRGEVWQPSSMSLPYTFNTSPQTKFSGGDSTIHWIVDNKLHNPSIHFLSQPLEAGSWQWFVCMPARWSSPHPNFTLITTRSSCSRTKWNFISMCLVRWWNSGLWTILMAL